jgi:hypothetical protein
VVDEGSTTCWLGGDEWLRGRGGSGGVDVDVISCFGGFCDDEAVDVNMSDVRRASQVWVRGFRYMAKDDYEGCLLQRLAEMFRCHGVAGGVDVEESTLRRFAIEGRAAFSLPMENWYCRCLGIGSRLLSWLLFAVRSLPTFN